MPFQSQQANITLFAASAKPSKMPLQDLIRATNNSFHSINQRNTVTTSIFKKNNLQKIVFNKCICQGRHIPSALSDEEDSCERLLVCECLVPGPDRAILVLTTDQEIIHRWFTCTLYNTCSTVLYMKKLGQGLIYIE